MPRRLVSSEQFLLWLTAPAQDRYFAVQTGDLPIRRSVGQQASVVQQMNTAVPGMATFIATARNRPTAIVPGTNSAV